MLFARPWLLLLLLVPVVLLVVQWRLKGRSVPLPFDHRPHRDRRFVGWLLDAAASLPIFMLAAVLLLLAGPRRFEQPRNEREMTNIQFCLDVSRSMTSPFGNGSAYDAAMGSLNEFITYREGDAFGLMIFGFTTMKWVPLTTDVSAFECAPPFLRPEKLPRWFGGTAIGKGLRACEKELLASEVGDRMIILISDGRSADLFNGQDIAVANSLRDNNIRVFAIHIGGGSPPPEVAVIASITGGQVFAAGDPQALSAVFQSIDTMQEAKLTRLTPDPVDFFQPFTIAALSLGGLWLLTLFGFRYNPW